MKRPEWEDEVVPLTADVELSDNIPESRLHHGNSSTGEGHERQSSRPSKRRADDVPWMSLPNKDQLFILALCRLSEPMSNTCLLPYIYYLMRTVLAAGNEHPATSDAKRISEMSGVLVAAFPLAQFATSMLWARFADSHGRRPIILGALLVSTISNLAFGFSRSFGALIFWRTLAGISNGNVGVMRTMRAEIVKVKKYETKAFLLLPLVFNSGMVFGLAVGGCLADPVVNLPWLFGPNGWLNFSANPQGVAFALAFPYALPALLNALMLGSSLLLALFGLKETLAGREHSDMGIKLGRVILSWLNRKFFSGRLKRYSTLATEDFEDHTIIDEAKPDIRAQQMPAASTSTQTPWTRDVICAIISFALLPLHNGAFMHIFPVFLSNPPQENTNAALFSFNGGLGLRSSSIGLWLSFFGLCGILLQLFIYPRMQARIGTLGNFRTALFMFPITYLLTPYLSLLPQEGFARWICIGAIAWSQIMARTLAIPSTVILLTNSAPAKNVLGRVHGAGNMLSSLARAIGPAVGGWVFAWGMERGLVGAVWWFYLFIVALSALAWSYTMRDSRHN